MPRLDALLQAMVAKGMDALVLRPGRLPSLRRGRQEHEVTRTPLDGDSIARLVAEIAPPGVLPDPVVGARWEFEYLVEGTALQIAAGGEEAWSVEASVATPGEPAAETPAAEGAPAPPRQVPASREIRTADDLLRLMIERGASDLHLGAGEPPWLRVDGELRPLEGYRPPSSRELEDLLYAIAPERNREEFAETNDTDFGYSLPGEARFRVNFFRNRIGIAAVVRQIPATIPSPEELGLPESVQKLAHLSKGLVLVTGPTGSGKSTTLASLVDRINRLRRDHIITIEDPIEFVHRSRSCLINQREVGQHTSSFKRALRAALREDPDIVLVGEMRDLETVAIAIETAETGHLVFGTLHTTTAPSTVERLVDQFPGDRQEQVRLMLADSLEAIIAQTLLRRIGGGRVAAFEILICTPAVSNLIREGKTFQIASAMQTGRRLGMVTLNDSLTGLVKEGLVEPLEAYVKAVDKEGFVKKLEAAGVPLELGDSGELGS